MVQNHRIVVLGREGQNVRVGLYARVSTKDGRQTADNQLIEMREFVERRNRLAPSACDDGAVWQVVSEYVDEWTGAAGDNRRDGLKALLNDATRNRLDLVLVVALDRFTRQGIAKAFEYVSKLRSAGVEFQSLREDFTKPPFGDLFLAMFAWMAKYEREQISKRVTAGVARARAQGKRLGRPKSSGPKLVVELLDSGVNPSDIARQLKIGRSTVYRLIRAAGRSTAPTGVENV